jgi:hypothetical protein
MPDPRMTDERLRTWLQSQAERERLCIALLPMFREYSDVRPRRPRGGPDGGRDIEAQLNGQVVWSAVGFQDHASDSRESRAAAVRKFNSDLEAAVTENPELYGFVFFTNVDLPPSIVEELEEATKSKNVVHVEIFHRERLREKLDSTAGLALRLQFLSIPMTLEEQTAFVHHLAKSHDARLAELSILLDAIRASVSKLEHTATATMDAVRSHSEKTIATVTGGDSYCALFFDHVRPFAAGHFGAYPLYDVAVRIVDIGQEFPAWDGTIAQIGDMPPGQATMLNIPFTWTPGDTRRANAFFSARNGSFVQLVRGYRVDDAWIGAWRVERDGKILMETIPETFKRYNIEVNG